MGVVPGVNNIISKMNPQEDEDYMSLVALILVLFILMLFCVAILIVGFMNTRKILKSSILFYALLGVFLLTKLVTELYFAVSFIMIVEDKTSEESKKSTLSTFEGASRNGMFVTDFVICSLFLILMKEFHTLQYEALLDQVPSWLCRTPQRSRRYGQLCSCLCSRALPSSSVSTTSRSLTSPRQLFAALS